MRDAVIDGEFEHFRIDHDQPALLRRHPVDQRQDHGVDGDRLAGAGGAGDQQMRHARQVDDDRLAADGLAEAERQLRGVFVVVLGRQQFAEVDLLARRIRQFDADGVAAGHHGDAGGHGAHRAGDVVGETDDARRLDAGSRLQFVQRYHRAGAGIDDFAAHAEIAEHAFQRRRIGVERLLRHGGAFRHLLRRQQVQRRQHEAAAGLAGRGARLRRSAAARRRRGRLLVGFDLDVVFLGIAGFRRHAWRIDSAERVEARILARSGGRRCAARGGPLLAPQQHPADPGLPAQQRVDDHALPGRGAIFFFLVVLIRVVVSVVVGNSLGGGRVAAPLRPLPVGGDRHRHDGAKAEQQGPGTSWPARTGRPEGPRRLSWHRR